MVTTRANRAALRLTRGRAKSAYADNNWTIRMRTKATAEAAYLYGGKDQPTAFHTFESDAHLKSCTMEAFCGFVSAFT